MRDRTEQVIARLRAAILDGSLPGADGVLPAQGALAERFGVSRTVVREAMVHLAAQGLIVVEQGRRARVRGDDPAERAASLGAMIALGSWALDDLLVARRLVEGECAAAAADAGTVALRPTIEAYRAATTRREALRADRAFHDAIADGSGNPVLALLYRSLADAIAEQQRETHDRSEVTWVLRDHQRIAGAIRRKDGAAARRAMHRHIDRVREALAPG
ncbi:MAG: FCD domain-containing protein [Planctomycetota bacterium]|jgi:GntR family transcriptional repressor for pyruvate dehydrogenase complex|nr:FCD domain-containing protein [Planctomycetota bacterium]